MIGFGFPTSGAPVINPEGYWYPQWYNWAASIQQRTGGDAGVDAAAVSQRTTAAQTAASAAQSSANSAQASANSKVSKAGDTMSGLLILSGTPVAAMGAATKGYVDAETARAQGVEATLAPKTYVDAETSRAMAAEALLAPKANPTFSTGIGVWGHAPPSSQPAAPVTLADVIAIIRGCGLSA